MLRAEASVFLPGFFGKSGKAHLFGRAEESFEMLRGILKAQGALVAQSEGIAAQFLCAFKNDFALKLAGMVNRLTDEFAVRLKEIPGCKLVLPVESNVIVIAIDQKVHLKLDERYQQLMVLDESSYAEAGQVAVRLMTSHATTEADVVSFCEHLKKLIKE